MFDRLEWSRQANLIADVLARAPLFDKNVRGSRERFARR